MARSDKQFDLGMLVHIMSTEVARWVMSLAVFRLKFVTGRRGTETLSFSPSISRLNFRKCTESVIVSMRPLQVKS
jgi:hypothetical protein